MTIRLLVVVTLINCPSVMMSDNNNFVGSVYIDAISKVYLKIEERLWHSFETSNHSDIILKIHTEHLDFYRNLLSIKRKRTENYKSKFEKFFGWEILDLNSEIEFVKNFALHDTIEDIYVDDTIQLVKGYIAYTTVIEKIHNITNEKDVFEQVKQIISTQNCSRSKAMESVNLVLFKYYTDISTYLLKAYSLLQLSYMILTLYGTKDYTTHSRDARFHYRNYMLNIQKLAIDAMNNTDRNYWVCDGIYPQHFAEVTKFMQGYIDNEVNLNREGSCYNTCSDYTLTKNYGCYEGTPCNLMGSSKGKCNGTVHSCTFIESTLTLCSKEGTNRRYSNVKYISGRQLGTDECHNGTMLEISSWQRWFVQCSVCMCFCESFDNTTDKYFSLQPVLSNKSQNKVVTGVALQKVNQTFFWKIAEAKLLPNGEVDTQQEDNWTPVKVFNFSDMTDGYDYHMISWQNRSINLDTLIAPSGSVVTGIQFKLHHGHLNLQIQATRFDFDSGHLYDSFEWISNLNNHRNYIKLDDSDVPEKSTGYSMPIWQDNAFVEFQPTDMVKDVSQTTIPYVDTQLVEPINGLAPLSGIGIYYKGEEGYGGSIAPKLVTYDYVSHIGRRKK